MHTPIRSALISVSNKEGVVEFAQHLVHLGVQIISTGGTAKTLQAAHIPLKLVSDITRFPEMMQGRVKTLHPLIHGGILGDRTAHQAEAQAQGIEWIDLVVCNLYPFAETVKRQASAAEVIENIDIGGPAMIRAAAKNHRWVSVVTEPHDYAQVVHELEEFKGISLDTRKMLAAKAFAHTASYDSIIAQHLNPEPFPMSLNLSYQRHSQLRYGENPHQQAAVYLHPMQQSPILSAHIVQGKALSYNNIVDAEAALAAVSEFSAPACVVVKHANPCGIAEAHDIDTAFTRAWQADAKSAFGGIVALNQPCSEAIAQFLSQVFIEVVIAPGFSEAALALFNNKPNCRVLDIGQMPKSSSSLRYRFIQGGLLVQEADAQLLDPSQLKLVTPAAADAQTLKDLYFAWKGVKHLKSNAILIAQQGRTLGIGCGQVSRVDAVELAIKKASSELFGAVLASDGFFPFPDSIEMIAKAGIKAIIQPGGSVKDQEIIEACNHYDIAMLMTGVRCFNH